MNFSAHAKILLTSVKLSLEKDKVELINDFRPILSTASTLLKTNSFDYWLKQIGDIESSEIPITKYGLSEARRKLDFIKVTNRNSIENGLAYICECLFTYSNETNMCEMQGDYHYYVYIPTGEIFKESTLGSCTLNVENPIQDNIRIAKNERIGSDRAK